MNTAEKYGDNKKNNLQEKVVYMPEDTNVEKHRTVKINLGKVALFREGEEPARNMPTVAVSFTKDDIEQLEKGVMFKSKSRLLNSIKNSIIKWCARAAGGLSEAEFYCTGMDLELNEDGEIEKGKTFFKRRYSCGAW